MLTKTAIALAIIVTVCSGALAVDKRQDGPENGGPVLINRCVPDYRNPTCNRHNWPEE
jgi:hypothetical protein